MLSPATMFLSLPADGSCLPMLRLTDVTKGFLAPDGRRRLVVDVPGFVLDRGEHVGLVGASGSGKTTLLHLVSGILAADGGRIELAGQDLVALDEPRRDALRAQHVGYVFQTFNLLGGYTALENVELGQAFGRGVDPNRAASLLEHLGLGEHLHHRPHQLSAGQQQRVALARALVHRPDLVLADEPTGALDPERALDAVTLLRDACREQGAALLMVSHDHDLLRGFDRVVPLAEINRAATTGIAS